KMTPEDDVEAYLLAFERCAELEAWPRAQWDGIVALFLVGDAQKAYFDLKPEATLDYTQLKAEILARSGVTVTVQAQRFHSWRFQAERALRSQMLDLIHLARRWLQPEINYPARIVEVLVMNHFLRGLLPTIRKWVRHGNLSNVQGLLILVERQLTVEDLIKTPSSATLRGPKNGTGSSTDKTVMGTEATEERLQTAKRLSARIKGYWCYQCNELGHTAIQYPNEVEPMQCAWRGLINLRPIKINRREMALMDTGSTVTLVSGSLVKSSKLEHTQKMSITCLHRDVNYYPTAKVQNQSFNTLVGVVPKLPYPAILGRD
uniref:SCAN box domain-containing protein n=1 Tax=Latimeria chalumnae TaxID=7897 RepID=H3B4T3_LATCH